MIFVLCRKDPKRVWGQAMNTCSVLLAILDALCRHSANFINVCLSSDCFSLGRSVAVHIVYFGRMFSLLGCNGYFYSNRFGFYLIELNRFSSNSVNDYVKFIEPDVLKSDSAVLFELCFVRDGDFCLPRFSSQEVSQMTSYISRE